MRHAYSPDTVVLLRVLVPVALVVFGSTWAVAAPETTTPATQTAAGKPPQPGLSPAAPGGNAAAVQEVLHRLTQGKPLLATDIDRLAQILADTSTDPRTRRGAQILFGAYAMDNTLMDHTLHTQAQSRLDALQDTKFSTDAAGIDSAGRDIASASKDIAAKYNLYDGLMERIANERAKASAIFPENLRKTPPPTGSQAALDQEVLKLADSLKVRPYYQLDGPDQARLDGWILKPVGSDGSPPMPLLNIAPGDQPYRLVLAVRAKLYAWGRLKKDDIRRKIVEFCKSLTADVRVFTVFEEDGDIPMANQGALKNHPDYKAYQEARERLKKQFSAPR